MKISDYIDGCFVIMIVFFDRRLEFNLIESKCQNCDQRLIWRSLTMLLYLPNLKAHLRPGACIWSYWVREVPTKVFHCACKQDISPAIKKCSCKQKLYATWFEQYQVSCYYVPQRIDCMLAFIDGCHNHIIENTQQRLWQALAEGIRSCLLNC